MNTTTKPLALKVCLYARKLATKVNLRIEIWAERKAAEMPLYMPPKNCSRKLKETIASNRKRDLEIEKRVYMLDAQVCILIGLLLVLMLMTFITLA